MVTAQHDFAFDRRSIRQLAQNRVAPHIAAGESDRQIPDSVITALAEAGCYGRALAVEWGGRGSSVSDFATQQEELAGVWASAAVSATWTNLSGRLIQKFGTQDQRAELLPGLAAGTTFAAVAWTEPHGGSDAAALMTTASRVRDGWVLNGEKCFIDNASRAPFLLVGARSNPTAPDHGAHSMFVVRREDPGFEFGEAYDTLGLRPCGVGWFRLRDCHLGEDRLLGTPGRGFYQMMDMVEFGRTGVAAMCLGMAEACLTTTCRFLSNRQSFGRKLSEIDTVIAKVADMRADIDAARLLTERAAMLIDSGVPCPAESALAKLSASEAAKTVTADCLQLHGGRGFTSDYVIERHFRDCQAFTIGEGTSEILRFLIGRAEINRQATQDQ